MSLLFPLQRPRRPLASLQIFANSPSEVRDSKDVSDLFGTERIPILNARCFSWSAILFYAYTSRIAFSTIGSPGTTARSQEETPGSFPPFETNPPRNSRATTSPPLSEAAAIEPCSPKAVYALANKVRSASVCRW